ncbi:hypothetical protein WR164_14850 [Philodulcilactobacillus myokoensis]|uniref:ABC-2 type transporter transmembrane domain-containing protein n=1 Tax=Philodulcilactobacillus myokoensis TaxID=2929573 RepID=A0A9W6B368_9LACO|nr:ABC transporter permease [Philodulcilactobacillus myokoensis]GLB47506.1 hypothetical protein WR164_14850 [Philodulcilactobacillus myokoensis]
MQTSSLNQIFVIAKHEIKFQIKSFIYWTTIFWPIIISITIIKFSGKHFHINQISNSQVKASLGLFIPFFIFMICISYVSIIANLVAQDKSNKISEMMMSIVSAKEQLLGKILAIYFLVLLHMLIYGILFFIYQKVSPSIILNLFLKNISIPFLFYIGLDILVSLFIILIMTAEISSFITDETQTAMAIIPVMILVTSGTVIAQFFNQPGIIDSGINFSRIFINIIFMIPPTGSFVEPILLTNGNFSYFEAYFNLIIQIVISLILLKPTIKHYQHGLLSSKHGNPYFLDMEESMKNKH